MRHITVFFILLFPLSLAAQDTTIDKGSGWLYFTGVPGTTPSVAAGSEVAINTLTREAYIWNRDSSAWQKWLLLDSLTYSGDTLYAYQNGSATALTAIIQGADGNGIFDQDNNGDTIRISTALLRSALSITGGAYGMNITSSSIPFGATSTNNISGFFTSQNSGTATYMNVLDVARLTTGTAAAGLGGRIRFSLEADNGGSSIAGYLGVKWSNPAFASPSSDFQVRLYGAGTEYDRLTLAGSNGQLTLPGYANNALNNVDSSLYVLAVDATGDVHTRAASGLGGDGNGMFSASNNNDTIRVGTVNQKAFYNQKMNNTGGVEFSGTTNDALYITPGSSSYTFQDGNMYLWSATASRSTRVSALDKSIDLLVDWTGTANDMFFTVDTTGVAIVPNGSSYTPIRATLDVVGDAVIRTVTQNDTLTKIAALDYTTGKLHWVDKSTLGSTVLEVSNDSINIQGGSAVKLGINELLRDSVTTTTMTVNLESRYQKIVQIDMTSATNLTLTVNNPIDAGVYTFHFLGVSGTDNVTWPAAFYDSNNTALGTDALTAGTMYTCYYSTADAKYFCK